MKFNFDEIVDRSQNYAAKFQEAELHYGTNDVIPLWIADMDFRTAPCIVDAIKARADQGIFGYTWRTPKYFEAVAGWQEKRNGWRPDVEKMAFAPGVVPSMRMVLTMFTQPGDKILIQQPVYHPFSDVVLNTGRELVVSPLKRDDAGYYTVDFADFEEKARGCRFFILCNPHNPVGRVWTREELRRLGEICLRHGVRVVADEIHCELTYEGHDYTPFASLSDDFLHGSVTCNSPSKAFNLAGMQIANIVSADADVRTGIDRAINDNEVCDVNPFGVEALMAAYDRGEEWLDRLREYLADNYRMLCGFFAEYLPQYPVLPLEGTYLVWIDCRTTGVSSEQIAARLLAEAKLMISPGTIYGPGGEDFIRLNIACPRSLLEEGLLRLRKVLGR